MFSCGFLYPKWKWSFNFFLKKLLLVIIIASGSISIVILTTVCVIILCGIKKINNDGIFSCSPSLCPWGPRLLVLKKEDTYMIWKKVSKNPVTLNLNWKLYYEFTSYFIIKYINPPKVSRNMTNRVAISIWVPRLWSSNIISYYEKP